MYTPYKVNNKNAPYWMWFNEEQMKLSRVKEHSARSRRAWIPVALFLKMKEQYRIPHTQNECLYYDSYENAVMALRHATSNTVQNEH